ncbi:MAG TPA: CoA transferase, partial [Dehalococcoidia bacterium]|nr:CoA transferase [Dehalococcoidia bacterium]
MLEPYRVLDLTDERGMLCGQMLADLGADVIAIEPPDGSPARRIGPFAGDSGAAEDSLFWRAYARNKRGITLDLAHAAGQQRLRELVRGADFLIESFAPGYLDGLGLGYTALAAINPRLVMVSITPFGQMGPKAGWAATDLTAYAASGALLLTGDDDRAPVRCTVPQAFLHAGAEAAVNALIAHAARERDGAGQHVDVSAQTAAAMATMSMILQEGWGEKPVLRVGGGVKLGPVLLRFIFPCKDGYASITFLFGTAFGGFTRRLMEWVYEEGFIDETTRDKDWWNLAVQLVGGQEPMSELERCQQALGRFALAHTKAELFAGGMQRKLLIVPVSTTADVVHSEQLAARGYWTPAAGNREPGTGNRTNAPLSIAPLSIPWRGAGGEATPEAAVYPGPFAKFSATPIRYHRPAPTLGQHNAEIFQSTPQSPPLQKLERGPGGEVAALAGLKVLDLTWAMVGPVAIRYLADYGATVVKVDSATHIDAVRSFQPFKDGESGAERSGLFSNVNCCKLGISINLSKPQGRGLLLKLVRWADIVAESFAAGALRRAGLDYETLRQINPGLIMLSTCLNGQDGPQSALAGFGTMGSALAGFGALTGWPDRAPTGPFGAYTDYVAPKFVATSLLAALDHRRRTGEGQYIDLSQVEAALHFLTPALLDYTVNGRITRRAGN